MPGRLRAFCKKVVFTLLTLGLAFFFVLVLGEVFLRIFSPQLTGPTQGVFDSQLGILPKPSTATWRRTPYYTYKATHDAYGRRVVLGAPQGASDRILFLGDSFVYGVGVADDQNFTARVQQILLHDHPRTAVINAGNPGIGTDFELRYLQLNQPVIRPTAVALFFFSNDYDDNAAGRYFTIEADGSLQPKAQHESGFRRFVMNIPGHDFIMSHSHVAALLRGLGTNVGAGVPIPFQVSHPAATRFLRHLHVPMQEARTNPEIAPQLQQITAIYMKAIGKSVSEAGMPFTVFYLPSREDTDAYRATGRLSSPENVLTRICAENHLRLVSLTPTVAAIPKSIDDLYFGEGHFKPITHSLIAPVIAQALEQNMTPSPGASPQKLATVPVSLKQ